MKNAGRTSLKIKRVEMVGQYNPCLSHRTNIGGYMKKKLEFIIPTAEQRERERYEQGMQDEYKSAELAGYRPIGE